eukprot:12405195-Karenia_brevis.AAC.1
MRQLGDFPGTFDGEMPVEFSRSELQASLFKRLLLAGRETGLHVENYLGQNDSGLWVQLDVKSSMSRAIDIAIV